MRALASWTLAHVFSCSPLWARPAAASVDPISLRPSFMAVPENSQREPRWDLPVAAVGERWELSVAALQLHCVEQAEQTKHARFRAVTVWPVNSSLMCTEQLQRCIAQ
ncbi:unnamed protein product [Lampetra planeri]